jgi:hypothetical protein
LLSERGPIVIVAFAILWLLAGWAAAAGIILGGIVAALTLLYAARVLRGPGTYRIRATPLAPDLRQGADAVEFKPSRGQPAPDPEPLVAFGSRRGLTPALLTVTMAEPTLDVDQVVDQLARAEPLIELPVGIRRTLQPGYTVLLDRGPAMLPFLTDVLELGDAVADQFPGPGRRILSFAGHPWTGVGQALHQLEPLTASELPRKPGRVLVVTDLGIGPVPPGRYRAPAGAWLRFDHWARGLGVDPLYLVPYPLSRVPASLRGLPIVEWIEGLTSRQVRRREHRT